MSLVCHFWGGVKMNDSTNPSALRSKKEICEALLRLMQQHPYEEITVKQIALEAKLVRKTFYRNFDSKDDVLDTIIDTTITEYKKELIASGNFMFVEVVFGFCQKHKEFLILCERNGLMYRVLQKFNEAIPEKHKELRSIGSFPIELFDGLDPTYLISMNIGGMWNVICQWVRGGMKDDPAQITKDLTRYIINMGEYAKQLVSADGKKQD